MVWPFVGRVDELQRLRAAASGATGRGLIVAGVAGVGKSRLLREATGALDHERFALWTTLANAATAGLPFGSLAHALPIDHPVGLSPAGLLRWAMETLHQQAAGRPSVFAVDDIHLLDPLSATLIYLIARSERAAVLATLRTGEPVHDSVAALWKDDLVERVELAAFTTQETVKVLGQMLGAGIDPSSAERLHRLSQGNALLMRELVLAARSGGDLIESYGLWRWTGRLGLPPSLVEVIDARLGQLDADVRAVVELVAFGEPLGLPLLMAATDPRSVELAEHRQLVRVDRDDRRNNVRLGHPLYGEVIRRRCPATRQRRLLAQLAGLVEARGTRRREDLLRVAVWRLDSATIADPAQLLQAGRQALANFDVALAARLVRACAESGGGFDAAELLATILVLTDAPTEALAVLDSVSGELTTNARLARWRAAHGLVRYWGLSIPEAVNELAEATARLDDPRDRAWVMAFESLMRLHHHECAESLRLARAVLDRPAASGSSRAVVRSAIAHIQALRGDATLAARTIAAIDADAGTWRSETPLLQLGVEMARGTALIISGDVAGIAAIAEAEFADLADAGEFHLGSGYLSIVLGQAARLRGQLREAMQHQRRACTILASSPIFAGLANAERAHAAALAGSASEAALAMQEADRRQAPTMTVLYPWLEHARCWVVASLGDVAGAAEAAIALAERLRGDAFYGHELIALHDAVRLGRAAEAVPRLARLAGLTNGLLAAVMADHATAAANNDALLLLDVAERFEALGMNLYAAEAAAGAVNHLREVRSTRVMLATALHTRLMTACQDPNTPGLTIIQPALSPRERQVADLAATGASSKEIAERLYLSPRTVDNHLRWVYAKLGVRGRRAVAAALAALDALGGAAGVGGAGSAGSAGSAGWGDNTFGASQGN